MKLKATLKSLWDRVPDKIKRVIHTGWVTFAVTFLAGITQVVSNFASTHNFSDAKSALFALLMSSLFMAGTYLRVQIVELVESYKNAW